MNETIFIQSLDETVFEEIFKYSFPENETPHQILIFCENILHAERVFSFLEEKGKNVQILHSKRTMHHNRHAMEAFRENKVQFLVSIDKLNEDIDVPNVEVAVFLRATDSLTVFLQQLGRCLRKTSKKSKAIILDFVANAERLIFLTSLIEKTMRLAKMLDNSNRLPLNKDLLEISGDGFEFTLTDDLVQVLDLIKALKEGYFTTWQEASEIVVSTGIKSWEEYRERYRSISLRLHSNPQMIYPDFPGWKIFLGTKYQTWQEASVACIKLQVKGPTDYKRVQNFRLKARDNKLPQKPEDFYEDFPGWKTFLGFKSPYRGWTEWEPFAKSHEFLIELEDDLKKPENICYFWKKDQAIKYVRSAVALPLTKK